MNQPFLLLAIVALLLSGCSPTPVSINDGIDKELRKTFETRNQSLINALWKNTARGYRRLATDRFAKKDDDAVVGVVREIFFDPTMPHDFKVLDEFYKEDEGSGPVVVSSPKHGYSVSFHNNTPEYYVSVIQIHPNDQQHHLIAAVYNKVGEEWLLDHLYPVRYSMYGKTAANMFDMAKSWEKRGFKIDAFVFAHGARNLLLHGGDHIIYDGKEEILNYYEKIAKKLEAEYGKLPLRIGAITSSPEILEFDMAFHDKGLYPAVHYLSKIPDSNYDAQIQEAEDIKEYMTKQIPVPAQNQGYVFYRRFTVYPGEDVEPFFSNYFVDYNNNFGK